MGSSQDAHRQGMYVEGKVNGQAVTFLVDTGSSHTLISEEVFDGIFGKRGPPLRQGSDTVYQADGRPLKLRGRATIELEIGDKTVTTDVTVAGLQNEGILGLDFLIHVNAVLDCQKLEIRTPWGKIICHDQHGMPFCFRVIAAETKTIMAGHEVILPGTVNNKNVLAGTGLVEPLQESTEMGGRGLVVARAVVKADAEILPVRVFNPTPQEKVIKQGTTVATLSSLEEEILEMKNTATKSTQPVEVPDHLQDLLLRSTDGVQEKHH